MVEQVDRLRVFVASPGDTEEERERLKDVIDEVNKGVAKERNLTLELVRWETDVRPGSGSDAQNVINRQLPDPDIVVGIFWTRLGTPTPRAESGTAEELEAAIERWRAQDPVEIMVYFNQAPIPPLGGDLDQRQRLRAFRQELQKENLVWEYDGVADFEKNVRSHLTDFVRDWPRQVVPLTAPAEAPSPTEGPAPLLQRMEADVDLRREHQSQVIAARLRTDLGTHGFGVGAANRATVVLLELLANARDHTDSREASVKVEIRTNPIRVAVMEVSHDGEPFDLDAAVQGGLIELQSGEREHGLLKVLRLASHLRLSTDTPPGTVAVECDVYDPPFLASGLFEGRSEIAPLYQEFDLPMRWRIGRETYVGRDLWQPLGHALQEPAPELLPLYFGGLRVPPDGYLAIEFVGTVVVSEVGSPSVPADISSVYPPTRSRDVVHAALEVQFNEWFASGRVVMYGHEVGVVPAMKLEGWAALWGLPCFTRPDELQQFLGGLD
jgi:anti-sigma regulatory factor (Ser/Thr protein kinase)